MTNCANPYILELNFLDGNSFVASQQVAELTREASVSELLESLVQRNSQLAQLCPEGEIATPTNPQSLCIRRLKLL